jgi:hypothetical protein
MGNRFTYHRHAERPAAKMWLVDDDGTLIDLSGYSHVFKIGNPGSTALLTKSSNITGAVGAGVEPTGTPNVTITWAAGDLDIAPGVYSWQLKSTSSALDRVFEGSFHILDEID